MLGFSLAELLLTLIIILFFIKPKDLPEISRFIGRMFYRGKKIFNDLKKSLRNLEQETGISDLKYEMQRGIAEEKAKIEEDVNIIVDLEGNEHVVPNLKEIRSDLHEDFLHQEIEKENNLNSKKKSSSS